jgi:hypothetical protein|tara:strand:+ start:30287 stop:30937 length:651 start_codon:yes stop_codon:yes gene_type:complete
MNFIGVDFSLNSPGICIWNDKSKVYHFINYLKPKTGTKAERLMQEEISLFPDVTMVAQPDFTSNKDYSKSELAKVKRYDKMADDIINLILQNSFDGDGYTIAFEGSSYGSKMGTNNMIDMAAGAAILKLKMIKALKPEDILTVAPTTLKKFAGKGNMSKLQLFDAFKANATEDKSLLKSPLWNYIKNIETGKKVPKPLDDLIDACYLAAYTVDTLS